MESRLNLVNSRATVSHFDSLFHVSAVQDEELFATMERENLSRRQAVHAWLKPTDMESKHDFLVRIRADYPGTCRWLLDDVTFKEWFGQQYANMTLLKLLWINGKPGAGKFAHA
jgi:hypothetical protein